jgi:hypothetical protein
LGATKTVSRPSSARRRSQQPSSGVQARLGSLVPTGNIPQNPEFASANISSGGRRHTSTSLTVSLRRKDNAGPARFEGQANPEALGRRIAIAPGRRSFVKQVLHLTKLAGCCRTWRNWSGTSGSGRRRNASRAPLRRRVEPLSSDCRDLRKRS